MEVTYIGKVLINLIYHELEDENSRNINLILIYEGNGLYKEVDKELFVKTNF